MVRGVHRLVQFEEISFAVEFYLHDAWGRRFFYVRPCKVECRLAVSADAVAGEVHQAPLLLLGALAHLSREDLCCVSL